jgi:hypothetical protein
LKRVEQQAYGGEILPQLLKLKLGPPIKKSTWEQAIFYKKVLKMP